MTTEQFYTYQEQSFDAFCKAVVRNESINAHNEIAARAEREIQLSALSDGELAALCTEDIYRPYSRTYYVKGNAVKIYDQSLGEVLQFLPPNRRDVILLCYFLDYNDAEIARLLHISGPTVNNRRTAGLRRLKKLLEDRENA